MSRNVSEEKNEEEQSNTPYIIQLVNANNVKAVEELLKHGKAKVGEVDESGMTPLHHSCYKGQLDMCKLLLSFDADVNVDSHDHNYSPLHFTALSGNADVIRLLLASGAKPYHLNALKRTAAQMAGFVGNHHIATIISNYVPLSVINYYTIPHGLETKPKLLPEMAGPLHNLITQTNVHPVFIALEVGKKKEMIVSTTLSEWRIILTLLCEKEIKRTDNVNEGLCLKLHFISYILKTLEAEVEKQLVKLDEENEVPFEAIIKKWLVGRPSDGLEIQLEYYVQNAIKAFPYVEMPLFMEIVRSVSMSSSGNLWSLGILQGALNGVKGFPDSIACSACGSEFASLKSCSKCKCAQYCNQTCQRLHWNNHKKFCSKLSTKRSEGNVSESSIADTST